tara:strand:+ start:271 stop:936 length:666 start_codon:yes stop_codon:yes gene_type:complete
MAYTGSRVTTPIYINDGTGEIEKDAVQCLHLVELHFEPTADASTELVNTYLTDYFHDQSYDSATAPDSGSNTYSAVGTFLSFSPVNETTQLKVNSINISLSGVDTSILSQVVNNDIVNKRVVIYRSFLDSNGAFQTNRTFMLFDGNIKNWTCKETPESATISLSVATHWSNWSQKNGRSTNKNSQNVTKKYNNAVNGETFADDNGFDYAHLTIGNIQWGPA